MADPNLLFDPPEGWENSEVFVTNPANQPATRSLFQRLFSQIQSFINSTMIPWTKDLDSANVKKTGDQSIDGVKTFTSSPIVPTPTTDMQAPTKKYVDDVDLARKTYIDNTFEKPTDNHLGSWQGIPSPTYADPGIAGVVAGHTSQLADIVQQSDSKKIKILAGVIRNTAGTWEYINDVGHEPINLESITQSDYDITIVYKFTGSKVGTLVVTTDETLAKYGITVGASVGTGASVINLYMPFSCMINGSGAIAEIPVFFGSDVTIAPIGDNSGYIITHPQTFVGDEPIVSLIRNTTGNSGQEIRLAYSSTTITLMAYSPLQGYINYSGSAWAVTTDNIDSPTLAFDTGTGDLTVTFAKGIPTNYSWSVTSRDGVYIPVITSMGNGSIKVRFKDWAGNTILTPDSNMKFIYSTAEKVRSKWVTTNNVFVRRGSMKLKATNVIEEAGNLWIHGVMQV